MNLPLKLNERERKFLIIGGVIVFLIITFYVFSWYGNLKKSAKEFSDVRLSLLQKQLNKLSEKDILQKQVIAIRQELEKEEKTFLRGDKPPVAAAALQKILKETASSLNIDVKLERTLNPVETDFYLGIPVEIGFTASTEKLKDLLYQLRKSIFLLTVSEIKIRVTNIRNPVGVYTTLVVTGFIKRPEIKNSGSKKAKNVT